MLRTLSTQAADYLAGRHVMTLATQGPDGPWAAAVFYVPDDDGLVFLSSPASRHGRNLARDARCAAAIHDADDAWERIRGIQLEGLVMELDGDAAAQARRRYARRFPFVRQGGPAAIVEALARVHWYRLVPQRLHFIDNSRGFGHRDTFEAPSG